MLKSVKENIELRPWWMNCAFLFCAFMTFIYLPWDIFIKPLAEDQEVWFGFLFTGWAAKIGALLHWLVYGAGFCGFWKMKAWLHPWAAVYVLQIAAGMLIWSISDDRGSGFVSGGITAMVFIGLAVALLRSKPHFQGQPEPELAES